MLIRGNKFPSRRLLKEQKDKNKAKEKDEILKQDLVENSQGKDCRMTKKRQKRDAETRTGLMARKREE